MCNWARQLSTLVLLSGQRYRIIIAPGSSPGVSMHVCNPLSPCCSSIKTTDPHHQTWSKGEVEFIKLGECTERCLCWSWSAVLRPPVASHSSAWMQKVGVCPLRHRADNTAPDGSVLWPVTQRSGGHSGVNRGQSLRTPHGVPLSSKGHVAH